MKYQHQAYVYVKALCFVVLLGTLVLLNGCVTAPTTEPMQPYTTEERDQARQAMGLCAMAHQLTSVGVTITEEARFMENSCTMEKQLLCRIHARNATIEHKAKFDSGTNTYWVAFYNGCLDMHNTFVLLADIARRNRSK